MPIGPIEVVVLLVIVLIVFGARKLPELGRGLGEGVRELRNGLRNHEADQSS